MKVYGLCAEKLAGKDTFANFAIQELEDVVVEKEALATPLKNFCANYLNLPITSCFGTDEQKNDPVGDWQDFFPDRIREKYLKPVGHPISGREVLQVVGTDIFRESFTPTFWLDIMLRKTIPGAKTRGVDVLFIPDVRFRNEVIGLREAGAKIIRLYRDIGRTQQIAHASELEMRSIPDADFDYIVRPERNTSMEVLHMSVIAFLEAEGLL